MKKLFLPSAVLCFVAAAAFAQAPRSPASRGLLVADGDETVSFTDGSLASVIQEVKSKAPAVGVAAYDPFKDAAYVKCVQAREVQDVFMCIFSNRKAQNVSLVRASAFSEMGQGLLTHDKMFGDGTSDVVRGALASVKGHDIPGDKLAEFVAGYEKLPPADFAEGSIAQTYLGIEREFITAVVEPKVKAYGRGLVIISSSLTDEQWLLTTMGHEFLHAQFFMNPRFKEATIACLRALESDPAMKPLVQLFVDSLKTGDYPMIGKDETLRANELMAYVLAPDGQEYLAQHADPSMRAMAPLVPRLQPYMLDFIRRYKTAEGWSVDPIIMKI